MLLTFPPFLEPFYLISIAAAFLIGAAVGGAAMGLTQRKSSR